MKEKVRVDCHKCGNNFGLSKGTKGYICSKYIDAAWNFYMEHSRVTKAGNIYINFGVTTKENLSGRIWARANGYERKWEIPEVEKVEEIKKEKRREKYNDGFRKMLKSLSDKHFLIRLALKIHRIDIDVM